jgi:hypothetical protein
MRVGLFAGAHAAGRGCGAGRGQMDRKRDFVIARNGRILFDALHMKSGSSKRRAILAGLGGVVAGGLSTAPSFGAQGNSPMSKDSQAILDKIARTDAGIAEPCIPVQSLPGSTTALYVISRPGSYYLTADIASVAGKNGLEIYSHDVDLDGYGFHMTGGPAAKAIVAEGDNITVSDLSVINWGTGCDFSRAKRFILWDVGAFLCTDACFVLGSLGQAYDLEAYQCKGTEFSTGFRMSGDQCLVEECAAFECAVGFSGLGKSNLLLSNAATACVVPFDHMPGNAWGPIVTVTGKGDISLVPNSSHPGANFVY